MKVVLIGSGNLATQTGLAMKSAGIEIAKVYSRTEENARALANTLYTDWTTNINDVPTDADLYLFALKDSVLSDVVSSMPKTNGVWVHTSGSMPMDLFAPYKEDYGVFYPLQTFSKNRRVDFSKIHIYNEYSTPISKRVIESVAKKLSDHVEELHSEKRRKLHLAAVFACNFVNHMYVIASDILEEDGIASEGLIPLIDETTMKIHEMRPRQAQTGPAIRYDRNVIDKHLSMLSDEKRRELYKMISDSIHKESNK
jgi:predicted short-subunit dehydrogenase-like oxidoreductase (DUF2520 family)